MSCYVGACCARACVIALALVPQAPTQQDPMLQILLHHNMIPALPE